MTNEQREKIFPMFKNNPNIIYLDNAALTFKPNVVIKKGMEFYEKYSISTRTADSKLGIKLNSDLQRIRRDVAMFINADPEEIIFTSGTTESLNLVAQMLSKVVESGEILFTYFNHSSAIVPFLENFSIKNIRFRYCFDGEDIIKSINKNTRIIVLPQLTNNFQINLDIKKIYSLCREKNIILINDAAQAIVHSSVDFRYCDVIAFSGNKLYGPTGTGILAIKNNILKNLRPSKWGGGQVQNILESNNWVMRNSSSKWEPGTPNFAGIIQLGRAIEFFKSFNATELFKYEKEIAIYAYEKLQTLPNVLIDSKKGDTIILFNIRGVPAQDVASYLGNRNIYVRSGAFCAYKFKDTNKYCSSYVRISLAMYNNKGDIDKLIKELKNGGNFIEII
ncbi:aminotransferase class V-fold PLP-dependent enzyme [Mycoplasma sp. 1781]